MKKKLSIVFIALALVVCMTVAICLVGCDKTGKVDASKAVATSDSNWMSNANRTATSVIDIQDLRLSLGEDNYLSVNLKATIKREIQGDKVTLTAKFSDFEIAEFQLSGDMSAIGDMLGSNLENVGQLLAGLVSDINDIDMSKLGDVSATAVVTYDKAAKQLQVTGLKLEGAADFIDANFKYKDGSAVNLDNFDILKAIKLANGGYDLIVKMGDIFSMFEGTVSGILEQIGIKLDLEALVNGIFFGQTLINIDGDKSKAAFSDNTFTNKVGGYDTLSFLLDPIKQNLKPGNELYDLAVGFPIIDNDTIGARIDSAVEWLTSDENKNKIKEDDITLADIKDCYEDVEKVVVRESDKLTIGGFFAKFADDAKLYGDIDEDEDYATVCDFIIKEGLFVGDIFTAIGGSNAIETLLGYFSFGNTNVTANFNGKFFDKINAKTTGVEINVPKKLLSSALDIVTSLVNFEIPDMLQGVVDTVLDSGIQFTIGTINVVNTYTA